MAKQTYTTGQVLTAAQMTTLQTNDFNQTVSAKTASYTLVAADAGTRITMDNASATTVTVNTAIFTAGDTLEITNIGAGICTVTAGTATVSTSSTLALKQFDSGQLYFTSTGVAIFFASDAADASGSNFVGAAATRTSGTQTISHATNTAVTLPTENYDTDAFHDTSSNTSRLTIPSGKAGKYHFEMSVTFNAFVTVALYIAIFKNGAAVAEGLDFGYTNITFNATTMISGSVDLDALVGDYFEMYVYQDSATASKSLSKCRFSCSYLGA